MGRRKKLCHPGFILVIEIWDLGSMHLLVCWLIRNSSPQKVGLSKLRREWKSNPRREWLVILQNSGRFFQFLRIQRLFKLDNMIPHIFSKIAAIIQFMFMFTNIHLLVLFGTDYVIKVWTDYVCRSVRGEEQSCKCIQWLSLPSRVQFGCIPEQGGDKSRYSWSAQIGN